MEGGGPDEAICQGRRGLSRFQSPRWSLHRGGALYHPILWRARCPVGTVSGFFPSFGSGLTDCCAVVRQDCSKL